MGSLENVVFYAGIFWLFRLAFNLIWDFTDYLKAYVFPNTLNIDYKEKYGQWILYDPEMSKNTYILWLLPVLLFLLGGAIIYKNLIIKKK